MAIFHGYVSLPEGTSNGFSLWLWLTVCELEAMAHRNRWFTELKDGDFPKNDGVCQLGWWMKFPTEWKVIKGIKAMFQTTNQPLPSGKHTKNYRKSPCSMGKSTVSMAIFNSKLLVYQRVIVTTKSWWATIQWSFTLWLFHIAMEAMVHRNRWFTELKDGWIFHGYVTNNQRVSQFKLHRMNRMSRLHQPGTSAESATDRGLSWFI